MKKTKANVNNRSKAKRVKFLYWNSQSHDKQLKKEAVYILFIVCIYVDVDKSDTYSSTLHSSRDICNNIRKEYQFLKIIYGKFFL